MRTFTSYDEACDYLFGLERVENTGIQAAEMKLEKMVNLLEGLDNPQNDYRTVHVAGTNGKGSTCSFLSAILQESAYRVGLHTSPHLFSFTERMKVNGIPANESWIIEACNRMHPLIQKLRPSFFEVSTAMSFLYFSEMEVDIAIIEVGLGGRLDATNIILPELSIITQIDFDHLGKLGNTKEEIAAEKGGIIKENRPILLGDADPKVQAVIKNMAARSTSTYLEIDDLVQISNAENSPSFEMTSSGKTLDSVELGLNGKHQLLNAALATAAAELVHGPLEEHALRKALKEVIQISSIRGRCEILSEKPFVVADVAHNPQGFESGIRWFLEHAPPNGKKHIVFGVSQDKDYQEMLQSLKGLDLTVFPVKSGVKRGLDTHEITATLIELNINHQNLNLSVAESVQKILKHSSLRDSLYIGGSHYTVGEVPGLFFDSN